MVIFASFGHDTAHAQASASRYRAANVAYPGAYSFARSLNNAGDVAGTYTVSFAITRAYVWSSRNQAPSVPPEILTGPYTIQRSVSINDAGVLCFTGFRTEASGELLARAVIDNHGLFTEVAPIAGMYSDAAAMNNSNHAAGRTEVGPSMIHAYLFASGATIDLGQIEPPHGVNFAASGLNDADVVIGTGDNALGGRSGFLWNGAMVNLGALTPIAINNAGIICGTRAVGNATRAFIRYPDGTVFDLPTLGGRDIAATGINNFGAVVGFGQTDSGAAVGFIYEAGVLTDINAMLNRDARGRGIQVAAAYAINDAGQILVSDGYDPLLLTLADDCPADFNADGGADGADVAAFFAAWDGGSLASDVNDDGGVDGADVAVFFAAWSAGAC